MDGNWIFNRIKCDCNESYLEYWKETGQSNNTGAGGRNKEEYRERISYGSEVTNYLFKGGDAYDLEKIHITRMATNQKSFQKDKYYMDISNTP